MGKEELDLLRRAFAIAKNEEEAATKKRFDAERVYAAAKAESVGIWVGSIVTVTQKQGYGKVQKLVTKRYRVTSIGYCSYRRTELTLWGVTIRKDGTDGERHEIWQDWEVEASQ